MRLERLPDPCGQHGTSPQGDGLVAFAEHSHDELGLAAAELLLAVGREEAGDRLTELLGEEHVGVDRVEPGRLGVSKGTGLARPHEAGEDEGGLSAQGRHPMRSL